jgi:large subunit ribosomal protein L15
MQIHQLQPKKKLKKRKRVGRGGKRGTYSGRGIKGQKARAGNNKQPLVRELIKKYPKLRGYRIASKKKKFQELNLVVIDKNFKEGDLITPQALLEKDLIDTIKKRVKILGKGELKKKFSFRGFNFSKAVREKIKKSGSKILE